MIGNFRTFLFGALNNGAILAYFSRMRRHIYDIIKSYLVVVVIVVWLSVAGRRTLLLLK